MKRDFVFFILAFFLICNIPRVSGQDISRSDHGEFYYLDSGLIISRHVIEPTFNSTTTWHGMADLRNHDSYQLTDIQTRYLDLQFLNCDIDLFNPQPSIDIARNQLKDCLKTHVWENQDIPYWAKIVGTAFALGAASEAGALDNEISVNIDLTSVNQLFKE